VSWSADSVSLWERRGEGATVGGVIIREEDSFFWALNRFPDSSEKGERTSSQRNLVFPASLKSLLAAKSV